MVGYSSRTSQRTSYSLRRDGDQGLGGMTNRMPWQRRAAGDASSSAPRPKSCGEEDVNRSVRIVEQAVENFAALHENCEYYKELVAELHKAFEEEKEQAKALSQQLVEAERAKRADRERADALLEQSARSIRELEHQLATVRAQTDRLVHTVARLMSVEKSRDGEGAGMAELLAA